MAKGTRGICPCRCWPEMGRNLDHICSATVCIFLQPGKRVSSSLVIYNWQFLLPGLSLFLGEDGTEMNSYWQDRANRGQSITLNRVQKTITFRSQAPSSNGGRML